ncbi:hypothetical protein LDG_6765 [Legionella drancourtii LLAP12]|uniref:Uncharacterized protein n=1 Tax=Legionella drancourtii LLAP12 TaxID=658187 RepID=G9ENE2_9GAMM|nr:hypothetical protein LDG_6765 [Legionella drancourtii LLAP12]
MPDNHEQLAHKAKSNLLIKVQHLYSSEPVRLATGVLAYWVNINM